MERRETSGPGILSNDDGAGYSWGLPQFQGVRLLQDRRINWYELKRRANRRIHATKLIEIRLSAQYESRWARDQPDLGRYCHHLWLRLEPSDGHAGHGQGAQDWPEEPCQCIQTDHGEHYLGEDYWKAASQTQVGQFGNPTGKGFKPEEQNIVEGVDKRNATIRGQYHPQSREGDNYGWRHR